MALTITNESKSDVTITNDSKPTVDLTWGDYDGVSWEDTGDSTWEGQFTIISEESKNSLSISNESKN